MFTEKRRIFASKSIGSSNVSSNQLASDKFSGKVFRCLLVNLLYHPCDVVRVVFDDILAVQSLQSEVHLLVVIWSRFLRTLSEIGYGRRFYVGYAYRLYQAPVGIGDHVQLLVVDEQFQLFFHSFGQMDSFLLYCIEFLIDVSSLEENLETELYLFFDCHTIE